MQVYIVNGTGGCGKDTFAEFMYKHVPGTIKISSIDRVKMIARYCGWDGGKTEKDRKFLSDLKCLLTYYNDLPFEYLQTAVRVYSRYDSTRALLIDIREPEEIERAVKEFNARTILIVNDRVPRIMSNMADANVFNYNYDVVIENNGTLEDLEETVKRFAKSEGLIDECDASAC